MPWQLRPQPLRAKVVPFVRNKASIVAFWTKHKKFGCTREDVTCQTSETPAACSAQAQWLWDGCLTGFSGQGWATCLSSVLSPRRKWREKVHPWPVITHPRVWGFLLGVWNVVVKLDLGSINHIPKTRLWPEGWLCPHCLNVGNWMRSFLSQRSLHCLSEMMFLNSIHEIIHSSSIKRMCICHKALLIPSTVWDTRIYEAHRAYYLLLFIDIRIVSKAVWKFIEIQSFILSRDLKNSIFRYSLMYSIWCLRNII